MKSGSGIEENEKLLEKTEMVPLREVNLIYNDLTSALERHIGGI